ncbi:MAG: T9SS type A sorting domain-containing protein [Candidatus Eisenbacteria bacterium]
MSMRSLPYSSELSALVLLALLPRSAAAAWPSDPAANVPLCLSTGGQRYPEAAPDGSGGAIVAWDDQRGGPRDIYVQRVAGTGTPRWTVGGVAICAATGDQYEPKVAPDGSGGAIVTWSDYRGAAFDIYAQRVDSLGVPKWTANGVGICTATNFQSHPAIVPDGSGGAVITWDDERTGNARIYAQRVNSSGVPQWTANGVLLTNSLAGQTRPIAISNGAGGAIVIWEDYRNGEVGIFGQRILSTGVVDPAWPAAGRAIALRGGDQSGLSMALDGSGGALVTWAQWNGGTREIRVQHVQASGAIDPAWPAGGRVVISDYNDHSSPAIVSDAAGGALLSWDDNRDANRDIYAQHVLATGALDPAWPTTGTALCLATGNQVSPRMVPDGAGGAIVTWHDLEDLEADLFAQHVTAGGAVDPAWPADGRALSTAGLRQVSPTIVADGAGGAVLAWEDGRNGTGEFGDSDIYAQGVKANGQLGDAPVGVSGDRALGLALESPSPNPSRVGAMIVRFTLPTDAAANLELFDVAGRRVVSREVGSLGAGHHAVDLATERRPAAGVYFVRLQQGPGARTRRFVVLSP